MGEANPQVAGQLVKRPTENQSHHAELCFRGHTHCPRHHVLGHAGLPKHVPRMDQDGCTFVSAVMQEGHDAGIVEVLLPDMVADLYAEMPGAHAAAELPGGSVDILQRNLTKGLQTPIALCAKFKRSIIEQFCAF